MRTIHKWLQRNGIDSEQVVATQADNLQANIEGALYLQLSTSNLVINFGLVPSDHICHTQPKMRAIKLMEPQLRNSVQML